MARLLSVCVLAFCLVASAFAAGPSEFFTKKDSADLISSVKASQNSKTGAFGSGIVDTYAAVTSLLSLAVEVPNKELVCSFAQKALEGDVSSAYHAVGVLQAVQCLKSAKLGDAATKSLVAAMSDSNVSNKIMAASALAQLRAAGAITFEKTKLVAVIGDISKALDTDGTIKVKGASEGSAYVVGVAYEALSNIWSLIEKETTKDKVVEIVATFENLVDAADETSQQLSFSHSDNSVSSIRATGQVVRGIVALSKAMDKSFNGVFDDAKVAKVAAFLMNNKQAGALADSASVIAGLKALNSGAFFKKPLVLSLSQSTLLAASKKEDNEITVRLTDLFGQTGPQARVYLARAYPVGSDSTALITNQDLPFNADKTGYKFNFLSAKPEAGLYNAEFRVTLSKEDQQSFLNVDTASRSIKVVASVEVIDAEIVVSQNKDGENGKSYELTQGKTHKSDIAVSAGQHMLITFRLKNKVSGKGMNVQQAFVLFSEAGAASDASTSAEDIFFVVPVDNARKSYRLNVDLSKFKNKSGKYTVRVLIGDAFVDNSFEWTAATVALEFANAAQAAKPSPFVPKPVINHKFRVPDKRAPAFLASVFTLLTLAPIAILLIGVLIVGLNFGLYPGGADSMSALLFHGSMVAFFGVYVWYWLALDIFEFFTYASVVAVPLVFFGHRTLRALYVNRQKAQ